jgi:hypothetical protein
VVGGVERLRTPEAALIWNHHLDKDDSVRHDLWYSERERSGALLHERDSSLARQQWPDARIIWTIDADTYAEAAQNCEVVLSWGNRISEELRMIPAREPSVRITLAFYRDAQGKECHIAVPGWVGRMPALVPGTECLYLGLLDHLAPVRPDDFGQLLGHVYVERAGRTAFDGTTFVIQASAPQELTVADLRSVDGRERLWQEFDGRYEDRQKISTMVGLRLGPAMSDWTITMSHVFRAADE